MKKLVLIISLFFILYLALHILNIVIYDLERLTDYGYGYLTGKVVALVLFTSLAYILGKKIFFSKKKETL